MTADEFGPRAITLAGVADTETTEVWCAQVQAILLSGHDSVRCDVRGLSGCAAAVLAALARIRLTAKRSGGAVQILGADDQLRAVLDLAGLADLLPCAEQESP
ncbi:STAS domain-containing protein [Nocardia goodfellowii]